MLLVLVDGGWYGLFWCFVLRGFVGCGWFILAGVVALTVLCDVYC